MRLVNHVARVDEIAVGAKTDNAFSIATPERTYFLCGGSDHEVQEWVAAVRIAMPPLSARLGNAAEPIKMGFLTKQGGSTIKVRFPI